MLTSASTEQPALYPNQLKVEDPPLLWRLFWVISAERLEDYEAGGGGATKLTIILSALLILGSLAVGLYAIVIFCPVADAAQRSDLIVCLGGHDRARQEKSLKFYKEKN